METAKKREKVDWRSKAGPALITIIAVAVCLAAILSFSTLIWHNSYQRRRLSSKLR